MNIKHLSIIIIYLKHFYEINQIIDKIKNKMNNNHSFYYEKYNKFYNNHTEFFNNKGVQNLLNEINIVPIKLIDLHDFKNIILP